MGAAARELTKCGIRIKPKNSMRAAKIKETGREIRKREKGW
jgi:hypothetical protein